MPEHIPGNRGFGSSSPDWSGTSTVAKQSGNVAARCNLEVPVARSSTVYSSRRASLDLALILADAQVPVLTVSGAR
jgi:hypothetical protein